MLIIADFQILNRSYLSFDHPSPEINERISIQIVPRQSIAIPQRNQQIYEAIFAARPRGFFVKRKMQNFERRHLVRIGKKFCDFINSIFFGVKSIQKNCDIVGSEQIVIAVVLEVAPFFRNVGKGRNWQKLDI